MARINRYPKGLQSLLGSKGIGKNPQDLAAVVQPTLDVSSFYYSDATLQVAHEQEAQAGASVYGNRATVEVPATEVWAVLGITTQMFCTTGPCASNIVPAVFLSGFDLFTPLGDIYQGPTMLANTQICTNYSFPQVTLFEGGTQFTSAFTQTLGDSMFHTYVTHYKLDV